MRVASIHVLAAATFVVSSVYMGPCMGSGPSNLDVEFGVHALGVGESVPNHWDRCGVRGNSLPVHRVGWTGEVRREGPHHLPWIAWRGELSSDQLNGGILRKDSVPVDLLLGCPATRDSVPVDPLRERCAVRLNSIRMDHLSVSTPLG